MYHFTTTLDFVSFGLVSYKLLFLQLKSSNWEYEQGMQWEAISCEWWDGVCVCVCVCVYVCVCVCNIRNKVP
jgi:hypothetical protein